ncbi:MAG TPA: Lrp/AsnC ligand binding domain-containing protein [Acidimicrobiia bacterium]|nr:Lrp/AsnC ligand binding domain-containing protein [Acidimicrobiia bacterium]
MITAIVLMEVEPPFILDTAQSLADLDHVSEVYSVTGEFDLVALVRVRQHDELADVVTGEIAKVDGIVRTETLVAFRAYSRHDLDAMFSVGS